MLLLQPLFLGFLVGLLVFMLQRLLQSFTSSRIITNLPTLGAFILLIWAFYKAEATRGFEGGAYMFFSFFIFSFSMLGCFISNITFKKR